jgi:hypothetical protein
VQRPANPITVCDGYPANPSDPVALGESPVATHRQGPISYQARSMGKEKVYGSIP